MLQDINKSFHEPSRLLLVTYLYSLEEADFTFLRKHTHLTQGNLSSHLSKLESCGYVRVSKLFQGKRPRTMIRLTSQGREAFKAYVTAMKQTFTDLEKLVR